MPLSRFHNLSQDKRERLLAEAAREFAAKGFEAASLNEILGAVGLGKSSYYYYFEDKEDLYATCVLDVLSRLSTEMPPFPMESLDASSFWPTIEKFLHGALQIARKHRKEMQLFRDLPRMRPKLTERFQSVADAWISPAVKLLRKGQKLGCVRTDIEAEPLFMTGIAADNALDEYFFSSAPQFTAARLEAHASLVLDLWKRIVLPAPPAVRTRIR